MLVIILRVTRRGRDSLPAKGGSAPVGSALEDRHLRVFLRRPFLLFRRESWPRLGESVTSPGGVGSCQEVSGSGLRTCDYNVMTWANVTTAGI
jgi:hypothetical protein